MRVDAFVASAVFAYQSIFAPHGGAAAEVSRLGVALTIAAVAVTVIMTVLVVAGMRRRGAHPEPGSVALAYFHARERAGVRWIVGGTIATLAVLGIAAYYSVRLLIAYPTEVGAAQNTVRITGYQYWWKVEYLDSAGRVDVTDANELHIPAGIRVKLELAAGDVIHSFWIPGLAGKTDLIPGQQNAMWIEADAPGTYRGQCAEYCGRSHANMLLAVVAQSQAAYDAWRRGERITPPADTAVARIVLAHGCGACHSLRGQMNGTAAPDLTHVARRTTLAAGVLVNNPDNLRAWLINPDAIKPGTLMPRMELSAPDIERLVSYLETAH
jgi:cytochrome c oxidase subunit 2